MYTSEHKLELMWLFMFSSVSVSHLTDLSHDLQVPSVITSVVGWWVVLWAIHHCCPSPSIYHSLDSETLGLKAGWSCCVNIYTWTSESKEVRDSVGDHSSGCSNGLKPDMSWQLHHPSSDQWTVQFESLEGTLGSLLIIDLHFWYMTLVWFHSCVLRAWDYLHITQCQVPHSCSLLSHTSRYDVYSHVALEPSTRL